MKSEPSFKNFKLLKIDMEKCGWVIAAFTFNYKSVKFIVLAKLYQPLEKKPKYALLKTEIINADVIKESITLPVNSNGFMTDARTLREFFNIDYSENLGDLLQQFNNHFSKFIPSQVNTDHSEALKRVILSSLSKSDSEDPNKLFCYTVKRNPNNNSRTLFNGNKTRLLRPSLYLKFAEEQTVSFCYSIDKNDEKSDEEILLNFSERT